jgi:hypothetical protein
MPFDADAVRRWLDDIHHHIIVADRFVDGMDYHAFRHDLCKTYGVTRCKTGRPSFAACSTGSKRVMCGQ